MSSHLLMDEHPLVVQPALAVAIGLNEAIVLQQVHYWLRKNSKSQKHTRNGHVWTYNSVPEWVEQFPFWSERTIWQTLKSLRTMKLLIAEQLSDDKRDRTLWYTVDYTELQKLEVQTADTARPISQELRDASTDTLRDVYKETETTAETTTERRATPQNLQNQDAFQAVARIVKGEVRFLTKRDFDFEAAVDLWGDTLPDLWKRALRFSNRKFGDQPIYRFKDACERKLDLGLEPPTPATPPAEPDEHGVVIGERYWHSDFGYPVLILERIPDSDFYTADIAEPGSAIFGRTAAIHLEYLELAREPCAA